MRVVIADCAIDLAKDFDLRNSRVRALQTVGHIGHFFADRGGRRRLAMGTREHR